MAKGRGGLAARVELVKRSKGHVQICISKVLYRCSFTENAWGCKHYASMLSHAFKGAAGIATLKLWTRGYSSYV